MCTTHSILLLRVIPYSTLYTSISSTYAIDTQAQERHTQKLKNASIASSCCWRELMLSPKRGQYAPNQRFVDHEIMNGMSSHPPRQGQGKCAE